MKSGWKHRWLLLFSRSEGKACSRRPIQGTAKSPGLQWFPMGERQGRSVPPWTALQVFLGTVQVVAVLGRFRVAQTSSSRQNQVLCGEHWERHTEGYYAVSCAWKYSHLEAGWCQSFHKQLPPPLLTHLLFILKQDRTREYEVLKEGRPRERRMVNVLVEHNLCLKPYEIFPENTHIWLSFNSTLNGCQVFQRLK